MSDLLYNEVPAVPGKTEYAAGDWQAYAIHDATQIRGFFGEYRFLSNFYCPAPVWFEGLLYLATEQAYQAAKVAPAERSQFLNIKPGASKKLWKTLALLYTKEEWEKIKYDIMFGLVFQKFLTHPELRAKLLATGDAYLEERNHWHDVYWGIDLNGVGENNLGKILMKVRAALR